MADPSHLGEVINTHIVPPFPPGVSVSTTGRTMRAPPTATTSTVRPLTTCAAKAPPGLTAPYKEELWQGREGPAAPPGLDSHSEVGNITVNPFS